jgi:hypothetical protein
LAYLGNRPAESFASFERQVFTIVNSQTAYTLSHSVTNENDIRLVVNNVVQEPGSGKAYTASGTTLTLSAALTNGTDTMYCVFLGRALQTVNAPNASVGSDQTAPTIITGQTELATAPASTDELLISDAGVLKRIDVSLIGGTMTPSFFATNGSTDQTLADGTQTKINFGTEIYDTDSAFASSRFTVPSGKAGKYYLFASVDFLENNSDLESHNIYFFKNGSATVSHVFNNTANAQMRRISTYYASIFDLSASDYIEVYFQFDAVSNNDSDVKSNNAATFFGGYKLIT